MFSPSYNIEHDKFNWIYLIFYLCSAPVPPIDGEVKWESTTEHIKHTNNRKFIRYFSFVWKYRMYLIEFPLRID